MISRACACASVCWEWVGVAGNEIARTLAPLSLTCPSEAKAQRLKQ
jgi:hypothetical protein